MVQCDIFLQGVYYVEGIWCWSWPYNHSSSSWWDAGYQIMMYYSKAGANVCCSERGCHSLRKSSY